MKYFGHLEQKEKDLPPPPPPIPEEPKEPYFQVKAVRRAPKIEDEDIDFVGEMNDFNPNASQYSVAGPVPIVNRMSRTNSLANSMRSYASNYGNVPYGARVHRASWSSRDFQNWQDDETIRADSPFGIPPRSASATEHHPHNSMSMAPLVRPSPSHGTLRPSTPTREQQRQHSSQRINRAN